MAHYQYQRITGSGWADQVYTSTSLLTPPANPTDTTKSAVAYNITTREIDWYRDTVSLVWRKAFNMDVLASITPTVSSWTVATTQDSARIANWTVPTASATYEWVILEVSWLTAPILPTWWPLLNVGEMSNGDLIICENSNGTRTWKKLSDRWGNEHLQSMNRATLVGLRNAGYLIPWRSYEITDHVQWQLVAGTTVTLLATWPSELSHDARVNTTYDNTSRFWLYDVDTALVYHLRDNRANDVTDTTGVQIANFDWANVNINGNIIKQSWQWTKTIGSTAPVNRNIIDQSGNLNTTGFTGQLNDNKFTSNAQVNFTNANGTRRTNEWKNAVVFNASGYTGTGDNYYNEFDACNINFSTKTWLVTLRNNELSNVTLSLAWASSFSLQQSDLTQESITQNGGSWITAISYLTSRFGGAITHTGAGNMSITSTENNGTIQLQSTGSLTVNFSRLEASTTIRNSGTATMIVQRSTFDGVGSQAYTDPASATVVSISDTTSEWWAIIRVIGATANAGTLTLQSGCYLGSNSYIYKRHTGSLTVWQCFLTQSAGIDIQSGDCNYTTSRFNWRNGTFTGTATGAVTVTLNDSEAYSRWSFVFSGAYTWPNFIQFCTVKGLSGLMRIIWTSANQNIQRTDCIEGQFTVNNCSVAMTHDLNVVNAVGTVTMTWLAVNKQMSYCVVWAGCSMNITGTVAGWLTRISTSVNSSVNISWTCGSVTSASAEMWGIVFNGGATHSSVLHKWSWILTTGNFNAASVIHISSNNRNMTANNTARSEYLWIVSSVPII